MNYIRDNLIDSYRWLTQASRRDTALHLTESDFWPAGILFYHRVADSLPNAWSISNENFVMHLDMIQEYASFTSIDNVIESQRSGGRSKLEIAISFDDGYSENLNQAIPEILRREIPCTYFVSTENIENGYPFTHDLERAEPHRVNTVQEIQWMASRGIQIGGHTATHLDLGKPRSPEVLRREIRDSRKKLQDWTGQEIPYFAFPFGLVGNMSQAAIDEVFESGYRAFMSAYGGWNFPSGDTLHLSRIHGQRGTASLRNWVTLDPRKIFRKCPLEYTAQRAIS